METLTQETGVAASVFTITACKAVRGHDGQGFNATLSLGGKKVAHVDDDGWGGGFTFTWFDKAAEAEFKKLVLAQPGVDGKHLDLDLDVYVDDLVQAFEHQKWMKRAAKTATIYARPNPKYNPKDEYTVETKLRWYTIKGFKGEKEAIDYITKKYPDVVQIHPQIGLKP